MAEYTVESKDLISVVGKCLGVISLGEKAESNSITLMFGKRGITAEAINNVASYQVSMPCTVVEAASIRMHILPELLLSYAKAHKTLTLIPSKQNLKVTAGKNFSAEIYFIGENAEVEIVKPEESDDIEKTASAATTLLNMVAGIRNRTDSQPLGVMLEWSKDQLELTIGDTHHAVVIDYAVKDKSKGRIVNTLPNLQRIMAVGQHFSGADDSRFIAWSDTEYLSMANQSENVFIADTARGVIKEGKRTTKIEVETAKFSEMIDTLTSAVDETSAISFTIAADRVKATIKTGASSAKSQMKATNFKGKEADVTVTVHHVKDCLSTMKDKTFVLSIFSNMIAFESKNKLIQCVAAMSSVRSK